MSRIRLLQLAEAALICVSTAYLLYIYPWPDLLSPTVTAGGDMASHYYPAWFMHHELLPRGQVTGWTMGNYAGFAIFHFYSTLPFVLIAALGYVFPMQQVFKLVTLLGPTTLPLAAAYLFRSLGYRRGAAAMAGASVLPLLFQQGNSMWGANLASVLAGEFCHSIGISLGLVFIGVLHRTANGRGSWIACGFLLAATGLTHAFAFIPAVWMALYYLWPRRGTVTYSRYIIPGLLLAFLLLCFWGLPLPSRVQYTTEFSPTWHISDWKSVLPELLWPAAALAAANLVVLLLRLRTYSVERHGLWLFTFFGTAILYLTAPAIGFPDIRYVPLAQMLLGFFAADFLEWAGSWLRPKLLYAAIIVLATVAWTHDHIGYLPSWLSWNYSGYEGKVTWELFDALNQHAHGDVNSPRMVFEHSQQHNRFGSSRAFENLPFFAGRSTMEGVFHQVSLNSPFAFYIQSEVSERTSGPFPQYTYQRLNPEAALPHLRHYNVSTIVAVSQKARAAYDEHPEYTRTFLRGGYAIYELEGEPSGYVVPATHEPVLFQGEDYKTQFFRWFKHPELLDIPLVPEAVIGETAGREFQQRADSVAHLPRVAYEGDCEVSSHLEHQRIAFDTTCPGRPHIVKVSYFPRWKTRDGSPVYPVAPGFMIVYPSGNTFELYYGRTTLDWVALTLSWLGLLWAILAATSTRVHDTSVEAVAALFLPLVRTFENNRLLLSGLFFAALALLGGAVRLSGDRPDTLHAEAQEAYRARDFERAIDLLGEWTATDKETFKQATALYQFGVSHGELGHHLASIEVHERLRFQFPNINYGAGTLYWLARNYAEADLDDKAHAAAEELLAGFADTGWVDRLRREHPHLITEPSEPGPNEPPAPVEPDAKLPTTP